MAISLLKSSFSSDRSRHETDPTAEVFTQMWKEVESAGSVARVADRQITPTRGNNNVEEGQRSPQPNL